MGLEVATLISELVSTNPVAGDVVSQGDDHIRQLKAVLQNTFPNADKPFRFPVAEAKTATFSVTGDDFNKLFHIDTTSANVNATLPALTSDDDGWTCKFVKTNAGTNPFFLIPDSGTIRSGDITGLSKTRRCIPGIPISVIWTGGIWVVSRAVGLPVGANIEYGGANLPVGFEWANGVSLASSALYPDYNSVMGGLTVVDKRDVITAGKSNMGGTSARGLLTAGVNGFGLALNPSTLGTVGGSQNKTIDDDQLPEHKHPITDKAHHHSIRASSQGTAGNDVIPTNKYNAVGGINQYRNTSNVDMASDSVNESFTGITTTEFNVSNKDPLSVVQPTLIQNFLVVVE